MPWNTLEVDDDVMSALKAEAEPFVDTPNSVLRRKFDLDAPAGPEAPRPRSADFAGERNGDGESLGRSQRQRSRNTGRTRVPSGELLPESEYELPILKALHDNGGRAATREVVRAVGRMVDDKLRPLDREATSKGGLRWESRVQFARLGLVRSGHLEADSPRGVWELSEAGQNRLQREATSA